MTDISTPKGSSEALSDLPIDAEYRSGDDPLNNFYIPALRRATSYDRAAGYFDSKSLQYAAQGIAGLIANGGTMRLITSPRLSDDDIEALRKAENDSVVESILTESLKESLFEGDYLEFVQTDRFKCLAWMIEQGYLEIKIAYLDSSGETNPFRHYHEKLGVISGSDSRVAFSGSINETALAWTDNYESFDVFRSWESGEETRIQNKAEAFETLWENENELVTVRDIPDAIKQGFSDHSPGTVDGLPALEEFFTEEGEGAAPQTDVDEIELWDHQQKAIRWWRTHDYQGLFAMATGSGKTLTALRATRLQADVRLTIVVVPSKILLDQWRDEITSVYGEEVDILECSGETDWKSEITSMVDPFRVGSIDAVHDLPRSVILTTLHTASTESFLNYLTHVPEKRLQIIIDEVHRAGAPSFQTVFDINAGRRIGLSATPDRKWDEEGTDAIYQYFGGHDPFTFTTQEAIENGYLTKYEYHPIICELKPYEFDEYAELSTEIEQLTAQVNSSETVEQDTLDRLEHLLRERANIKKRADNKPKKFEDFLSKDHPKPALVFCEDTEQVEALEQKLKDRSGDSYGVYTSTREEEQADAFYRFEKNAIDYLLAIKCLDEGVDVPDCSTALIIASSRNEREFIQRRGRVLRQSDTVDVAQIYDIIVLPGIGAPVDDDRARKLVKQELERAKILMNAAENKDSVERDMAEVLDSYGETFELLAYL
jgi:superfamily II DNA or RNA helicase